MSMRQPKLWGDRLGSRKRRPRITLRGNWSAEVWILVAIMLFMLFVAVPWLISHPPIYHRVHVAGIRF